MGKNSDGFIELVLIDKVEECDTIKSFYFKSKDGDKLQKHKSGQFIPLKIQTDDVKYKDVIRAYSLSNEPDDSIYRISVKKIEGGLISSYLHDNLKIGDVIEIRNPCGMFVVDDNLPKDDPIVLISGGIGVTPLISMLYDESKKRDNIHFVQAVQHSKMHPFKSDIENICKQNNFKNIVFYSNPIETDKKGIDYDEEGFITQQWIENNIPLNANFYFCGPPIFMKSLEESLLNLNVPKEKIHYEYFMH